MARGAILVNIDLSSGAGLVRSVSQGYHGRLGLHQLGQVTQYVIMMTLKLFDIQTQGREREGKGGGEKEGMHEAMKLFLWQIYKLLRQNIHNQK